MLVLEYLNSSLPAIFDEPFLEQHSHNTRGASRIYVLNIPKMKTSFYCSKSLQVKSIKDWNIIIDKMLFTTKDFMKPFEVIKKINYPQLLPFCLYLKHNPWQLFWIIIIFCPFCPFRFLLFVCLSVSCNLGSYCFLFFLYQDLRNSKHCMQLVLTYCLLVFTIFKSFYLAYFSLQIKYLL